MDHLLLGRMFVGHLLLGHLLLGHLRRRRGRGSEVREVDFLQRLNGKGRCECRHHRHFLGASVKRGGHLDM